MTFGELLMVIEPYQTMYAWQNEKNGFVFCLGNSDDKMVNDFIARNAHLEVAGVSVDTDTDNMPYIDIRLEEGDGK